MDVIPAGDALAIASATSFSLANILIARGSRPEGGDNGAFLSLLVTAAIAGAGWAIEGTVRGFEPVTRAALLWFAGAGVFTAFIGRVFYYASVQALGAMRSSAMKRLNPFFSVLLGVLVMRDAMNGSMLTGLVLIASSFIVLVAGAWRRGAARSDRLERVRGRVLSWGYFYGPISALGYATGYMLRKMGLAEAHDAMLGAAVGCLVGALLFLVTAAFNREYARAVKATFGPPNPWLIAAGVMSSFGQILYFYALNASTMSRVALLSAMEIFVTLFLGSVFLRKRETLTPSLLTAAALGFGGSAFIILH
ncbi:MAG TPA: DMT family transporter [Usitatibacter sp.]|jgi:drug/metabolite transporter (DMT)-like permease|nr:DMT family transporter [Usitatibacter sp.]